MTDNSKCIEQFNKLLRGELSALETYKIALDKVDGHPEKIQLEQILKDHANSIDSLRRHITKLGGAPETNAGLWGTFAETVQNTASVFGDSTALEALEQGEKHGINDYDSAASEDYLLPECRTLITHTLKPKCEQHVQTLERLKAAQ